MAVVPGGKNPFAPPAAMLVEVAAPPDRMPRSVSCIQVPIAMLFLAFMAGGLESVKKLPPWEAALVLAAGGAIAGAPVALLLLGLRLRRAWVWWSLGAVLLVGSVLLGRELFFTSKEGWRHFLRGGPLDAMELVLCPAVWLAFALWMTRSARAWFRKPRSAAVEPGQSGSR